MPLTHRVLVHDRGPALWPEHKPLSEVLRLRDTTPEYIWHSTYQCVPVAPGGSIFKREWWANGQSRFDPDDVALKRRVDRRYISLDTAMTDKTSSDYTACTVGELLILPGVDQGYVMAIREVWQKRLQFPDLLDAIRRTALSYEADGKTEAVLIEDKNSGISATQTLRSAAEEDWLARLITPWPAIVSKEYRAGQASPWCMNGSVLLPHPAASVPWLPDFEDQLFAFPGAEHDDMVDSFTQLIVYTENLISMGFHKRRAKALAENSLDPPTNDHVSVGGYR